MAVPGNKEYVITFRKENGEVYAEVFRTMKHFCRWFNESERDRVIGIEEVDGDPYYDKYFKNKERSRK